MHTHYQDGTIYETGKRVKKWAGRIRVYEDAKAKRPNIILGLKSEMTKRQAEAKLRAMIKESGGTPAPVLLVQFSAERLADYFKMAASLRAGGLGVEVFPEAKKVGQQLQYAEKRGFRVALIAGPDEFAQGVWKVKDLTRRAEVSVGAGNVGQAIREILGLDNHGSQQPL